MARNRKNNLPPEGTRRSVRLAEKYRPEPIAEEPPAFAVVPDLSRTNNTMPNLSPIQLGPPPIPMTVVVNYDKAVDIIKLWKEQLLEHLAKVRAAVVHNDNTTGNEGNANHPSQILCDRIYLSGNSYTAKDAQVIASFLNESLFDDVPPLAHGIVEADLSNVIVSLGTEEGVIVLKTLCDAFTSSNLVHVDISENAIGEQGFEGCEAVLTKKSLERLCLNNAGLALKTMTKLADILTRDDEDGTGCIARNLTKFQISCNKSDDVG